MHTRPEEEGHTLRNNKFTKKRNKKQTECQYGTLMVGE